MISAIDSRSNLAAYLATGFIFLMGAFVRADVPVNHDIAWMLVASARMLAGGSYAADFFDVQMPLAIAIYMPSHLLASLLRVELPTALNFWVFSLIAQSVVLSRQIAVRSAENTAAPVWSIWLTLGLLFLPGYDFAQKEHLTVILTLPFVEMQMGRPAVHSHGLRIYVSMLAALGCYLKPHYAFLPLLLVALRAYRDRDVKVLRSIEIVTLLAVGVANAVFVLLWYPDWFTNAKWASDLYGAYRRTSLIEVLGGAPYVIFSAPALFACILALHDRAFRTRALPLLLMTGYGMCAYLLQFKGWEYQFLTASLTLFLVQGLALSHTRQGLREGREHARKWFAAAVLGSVLMVDVVVVTTKNLPQWPTLKQSGIGQALSIAQKGDQVYALSTAILPVFPTVVHLGLAWGSRFPSLWPLAGLASWNVQGDPDGARQRSAYERKLRDMVTADFVRFAPSVVLLDRRARQFGLPPGFNILEYFLADRRFAELWHPYVLVGQSTEYAIFVRTVSPKSKYR